MSENSYTQDYLINDPLKTAMAIERETEEEIRNLVYEYIEDPEYRTEVDQKYSDIQNTESKDYDIQFRKKVEEISENIYQEIKDKKDRVVEDEKENNLDRSSVFRYGGIGAAIGAGLGATSAGIAVYTGNFDVVYGAINMALPFLGVKGGMAYHAYLDYKESKEYKEIDGLNDTLKNIEKFQEKYVVPRHQR